MIIRRRSNMSEVEQAYRDGYIKGLASAQEENAELRNQIRNMNDMINNLRLAIQSKQEDYYE